MNEEPAPADEALPTADLVRMAIGGDAEWGELLTLCVNRKNAAALARGLAFLPPEFNRTRDTWLEVIRELHPKL